MYTRQGESWVKHLDFLILDLICIQISFVVSYCFRHGWQELPYKRSEYVLADIIICLVALIVAIIFHAYAGVLRRGMWKELAAIIKQVAITGAIVILVLFAMKETEAFSRITLFLMPVVYTVLAFPLHQILKAVILKRGKSHSRSLLIVSDESKLEKVVKDMEGSVGTRYKVAKTVTMEDIIAGVATADDLVREWIDEALIVTDIRNEKRAAYEHELEIMGITIHDVLTRESTERRARFYEEVAGYPTLTISVNEATPLQALFKRVLDITGGLVGSFFCILILIVVGPIIYIKDPGPIIFKQIRIGKNGKKFKFLKIRSMYKDAEARKKELMEQNKVQDGMMFKMDNDPRILPGIGKFIRETSLDEFPQFFNVLAGDMSLVGTRPPTVDEWEKYGAHHRLRLAIKPGITGMWQVSGRSEITNFEDVLKLDTDYIYNWTPGLDLRILWNTVVQVIKRNGAE